MSLFQIVCTQCGKPIEASIYKCPHCGHEWELMEIVPPKGYGWIPQKDITAYELALCIPVLNTSDVGKAFEMLPPEVKRHFKVKEITST